MIHEQDVDDRAARSTDHRYGLRSRFLRHRNAEACGDLPDKTNQWRRRFFCGARSGSIARGFADRLRQSGPNAAHAGGAKLSVRGCPSLTANDLMFVAADVPTSSFALLRYGSQQAHMPFSGGWDCLGGRVLTLPMPVPTQAPGVARIAIDLTQPPFSAGVGAISAGSSWNFQMSYRDGIVRRTTDALHVVFAP